MLGSKLQYDSQLVKVIFLRALTFADTPVGQVIGVIRAAAPARPGLGLAYSGGYHVNLTFLRGTNVLDHIEIGGELQLGGELFLLGHAQPPFEDKTGFLKQAVCQPVGEAVYSRLEHDRSP